MTKVPTLSDLQSYTGLHCHRIWAEVGPDYICPCCNRNKFELLKWSTRNPGKPNAFKAWVAILHRHHDHSGHFMNRNSGRFRETIICGQCNAADGAAKRKHQLPKDFSFSPEEIQKFVVSAPHSPHKLDLELAKRIFNQIHSY